MCTNLPLNLHTGCLRVVGKELYNQEVSMEPTEITEEQMGDRGYRSHVVFSVTVKDLDEGGSSEELDTESGETGVKQVTSLVSAGDPGKGQHNGLNLTCPKIRFPQYGQDISITADTFCSVFPFHILFDQDLVVKQCGSYVAHWSYMGRDDQQVLHLDELFVLEQPNVPLTYENILKFSNQTYIMEAQAPKSLLNGTYYSSWPRLKLRGHPTTFSLVLVLLL